MIHYKGFSSEGKWFKGNLHCHTTVSDGMLSPEEAVNLYKENGYHFLCISDHDIFSNYGEEFNSEEFILIPSVEYSAILYEKKGTNKRYKVHHMHGILGTEQMQKDAEEGVFKHMEYIPPLKYFETWDGKKVAQDMADILKKHGNIVTYNHPIWSRVSGEEFMDTEGISMLEIFNYNTVQESNTGYDVNYWDQMLRKGKRIHCFASDDNHNEGLFEDSCGGWISIKTEELTHENIVEALLKGNYYSSSGPEIYDWGIDNGSVFISCSPVQRINFIAGNIINDGTTLLGERNENSLQGGSYELKGHETYVRIEAVDKYGNTAWTNPVFLEDIFD